MVQETIRTTLPILTIGAIGIGTGSISSVLIEQTPNKITLLSSLGAFIVGGALSIIASFIVFFYHGKISKIIEILIYFTMFLYLLGSLGLISSFYHLVG